MDFRYDITINFITFSNISKIYLCIKIKTFFYAIYTYSFLQVKRPNLNWSTLLVFV